MRERLAVLQRLTLWGFPAFDVALSALFLLIALASVVPGNPDEGPLALTVPVALATTIALLWRTREPFVAVGLAMTAGLVQSFLSVSPGSLWALVVYGIITYSAAATYSEGRAAVAGFILVAGTLTQERLDNGVDYVFIVVLFGGIWLLGRASRIWRSRVSHSERHEKDAARIAVAEERIRIARELHDIVAHSLSVISIQSDAGEAALATRPERARESLQTIRTTARDSLAEIRQLLDVLRTEDAPAAPVPGLLSLGPLVETARAAGLPVRLQLDPNLRALAPTLDTAVYRIVQEAMTNVLKHAGPVATVVSIHEQDEILYLEVTNARGSQRRYSASPGYGLIGIRERVLAIGGTLEYGPTADRYLLTVRVQLGGGT